MAREYGGGMIVDVKRQRASAHSSTTHSNRSNVRVQISSSASHRLDRASAEPVAKYFPQGEKSTQ